VHTHTRTRLSLFVPRVQVYSTQPSGSGMGMMGLRHEVDQPWVVVLVAPLLPLHASRALRLDVGPSLGPPSSKDHRSGVFCPFSREMHLLSGRLDIALAVCLWAKVPQLRGLPFSFRRPALLVESWAGSLGEGQIAEEPVSSQR
jgi:hypothetical protein